ncbi:uncharacterized protein LOC126763922 [Bactrocera neohumeralis]|uniref:uncharacterized protein LOC126763922 n=1 Tax=Bactrocera neohumeralis TaxID=98809 RepID=UPI002166A18A|nr:uncharacterized protein LOC126763922 [Bactrocera neohumeralis]
MLTAFRDNLSNPHRNCIHEILSILICHDNDLRRIKTELHNLQDEFKECVDKINFGFPGENKKKCEESEKIILLTRKITTMHDVNECFSKKIEALKKHGEEIVSNARQCIADLNAEKCKFRQFHEKSIDYLKRYAIQSDDTTVINNCERDICEMHKLFVKEVSLIKKCETELESFFQICILQNASSCCCFKDYNWLPQGKTLHIVDGLVEEIKCLMGTTLSKAFAQFYVHHSAEIKSFLASYLMNIEHNEEVLQEKLNIFGNLT